MELGKAVHIVPADTRLLHAVLPTCWCAPVLDERKLVWTHHHPAPERTSWWIIKGPTVAEA